MNFTIDNFRCPITRSIFNQPVLCEDGHFYERDAIESWFSSNKEDTCKSPLNNKMMRKIYFECFLFNSALEQILKEKPELKEDQYAIEIDLDQMIIWKKYEWLEKLEKIDLPSSNVPLKKRIGFVQSMTTKQFRLFLSKMDMESHWKKLFVILSLFEHEDKLELLIKTLLENLEQKYCQKTLQLAIDMYRESPKHANVDIIASHLLEKVQPQKEIDYLIFSHESIEKHLKDFDFLIESNYSDCFIRINPNNLEWLCKQELPPSEGLMCLAIRYDHGHLQSKMLELGISFNCPGSLFAAIHARRPKNVRKIIDLGYNLEDLYEGKKLLDVAYATGNEMIIGMLYDYGATASPNVEIEDGSDSSNMEDVHGFLMALLSATHN